MTFDPSRPGGQPSHGVPHGHDPAQAFEDKETIQRMDVPEAAQYIERSRAARAAAAPGSGVVIDWLLPLALGLLAALVLAVLTWLVVIE